VFVAAKPRQANRCWPRDPAGHYPNPSFARIRPQSQIPSTRHAAAAALGSEIKGRLRQILLPPLHTSSLQQRNKSTPHARAKRVESQARPRWSLAAEALRLETGTSLCYLWS
jgi:hypothetical protein